MRVKKKYYNFKNTKPFKCTFVKNLQIFCKFFESVYCIFDIAKYILSTEFYYAFNFSYFYKNILLYKKYMIYILNNILNLY